jgi:hypothetical protein
MVITIAIIGTAFYLVPKRQAALVHWVQQFAKTKAVTKVLDSTTEPPSLAKDEHTPSGNLADREQLPRREQKLSLGILKNRGVRLDLAEDMRGFEHAALSGDANAQLELGTAYALGRGVPADAVTAYTWLTLALVNGKPQAESLLRDLTRKLNEPDIARVRWNLGQMYANGIGVPADKITAYMWQALAASAGETRSSSAQSELAASMRPDEVYEAQVRASEWLNRHRRPVP